jgi:hypothetical protein
MECVGRRARAHTLHKTIHDTLVNTHITIVRVYGWMEGQHRAVGGCVLQTYTVHRSECTYVCNGRVVPTSSEDRWQVVGVDDVYHQRCHIRVHVHWATSAAIVASAQCQINDLLLLRIVIVKWEAHA